MKKEVRRDKEGENKDDGSLKFAVQDYFIKKTLFKDRFQAYSQ